MVFTASSKTTPVNVMQPATQCQPVLQREVEEEKEDMHDVTVQPKLSVGAPDDPYEKEADSVANKVMRMPEQNFVQRKCNCEREEKIHRQEDDEEKIQAKPTASFLSVQRACEDCKKEKEIPLQPKLFNTSFIQAKANNNAPVVSEGLARDIQSSKGGGYPLDNATRFFMQSRFNSSFDEVKIHSNSDATKMNRSISAKAFTVGNDIYFNELQYQPHTAEGKTLLAHELTHVIQQRGNKNVANRMQKKDEAPAANVTVNDTACGSVAPAATLPPGENATPQAETNEQTGKPSLQTDAKSAPAQQQNASQKNEAATPPKAPAAKAETEKEKQKKVPDDAAFDAVVGDIKRNVRQQKKHEAFDAKVKKAGDAANTKDDTAVTSGAVVLSVDDKVQDEKQKPKEFNADEFKRQLKEKIISGVPQEEKSVREFIKDETQVNAITESTQNNVTKEQADVVSGAKKIESANEADAASKDKIFSAPGTDYEAEQTGNKPVIKNVGRAIPKPADNEEMQMDKEHNAASLDKEMADNKMTNDQLADSEEPQFLDTLDQKKTSQKELCKVPAALKTTETKQLLQNETTVRGELNSGMNMMFANRDDKFKHAAARQQSVQQEEEQKLKAYYDKIKFIYTTTETNVKSSLSYLECIVSCTFQEAITAAFEVFKRNVNSRLDYYYDWHIINPDYEKEDKFTDAFVNAPIQEKINALKFRMVLLPPDSPEKKALQLKIDELQSHKAKLIIEKIFDEEKALFVSSMDTAIDNISVVVANGLNEAKTIINKGRNAVDAEYNTLDEANKKKAKETTDDFTSKFSDLDNKVNDKEEELTDTLAKQYNESVSNLTKAFEEIRKEAALSWWEKAWNKIKEVALIIYNLGKTLLNILVKAANVIGDILAHPIRFFENLIKGITTGFRNFIKRLPQHLEEVIFKLIMGVIPPEITLPEKWDVKGIFSFVLDVLGLSKNNIRAQAIKRFGEPVVQTLEKTFDLFIIFYNEGFVGLWEHIKEKIGDLKDAIIEEVKTFFKESVIRAVVEFIISALTPASGFIKVCKSIINIVMFLVKNLQNILTLLDNILDSLADIAVGKIDKAANKVENAITDILVVGIKFLASLVGINLDKIQAKVSKIINAVRNPVNRALAWLFDKAHAFAEKTGLLKLAAKGKAKYEAGKQWAKEKVEAGKEKVKSTFGSLLKLRRVFKSGKNNHTIYFRGTDDKPEMMVASKPKPLLVAIAERKIEMQEHIRVHGSDSANNTNLIGLLNTAGDIYINKLIATYRKKRIFPQEANVAVWDKTINDASTEILKILSATGVTNADFAGGTLQSPVAVGGYIKTKDRSSKTNKIIKPTYVVLSIDNANQRFRAEEISPDSLIGKHIYSNFNFDGAGDAYEITLPSVVSMPTSQLKTLNAQEAWANGDDARRILNYRVHERQDINPSGNDWEHVVEQSTSFPATSLHSSDNLILADASLNKGLGQLYGGKTYMGMSIAYYLDNTQAGKALISKWSTETGLNNRNELKPRDYLRTKSDFNFHKTFKHATYAGLGKRESSFQNKNRGRFKTLT